MAAAHINQETFEQMIAGEKPVLVDFSAPWCTYCRRIDDAYDAVADQYGQQLTAVRVNIDDEPKLAQQEGIELVPTLVLYHQGRRLGSVVAPPSKAAIEDFIGEVIPQKRMEASAHVYDMVIIGGGPAGYTAALYAVRAGLDTLLVEKLGAGGQMAQTHQVDNYPGFEEGVDGFELAQKMKQQAERFGAESRNAEVTKADLKASPKVIETSEGTVYAKTVVLAMGASPRELGVDQEKELTGRGVAYCAACDGMFYRGRTVTVVGGGNTAAADALLLSRVAKEVILIHRRDTLRATKIYHDPLLKAPNVSFRWNSVVTELQHDDRLTGVRIRDVQTGEESTVACDGLFVSVGRKPATELVRGQIELDEGGYVIAGENTQTNLPGVYAAGDVRSKPLRQIVTAVADGATAVHMAEAYLAANC